MAKAEFYILGTPELQVGGDPQRLHSKKVTALFGYLVLEDGRSHSRNRLATLLWGNSTDKRAKQSLRQAVYSLQQVLGKTAAVCFNINAESVTYYPHIDLWVDAAEFLKLAGDKENSDSLLKATTLYQGSLLDGLELQDGGAYEEWLFFQRARFRQHALNVNKRLIKNLVREGSYDMAIPRADWLMAHEKLDESAHRLIMRLYAALGDLDAVRRQYEFCAEILKDELSVDPTVETTELFHELLDREKRTSANTEFHILEETNNPATYLREAAQEAVYHFHYPSATDLYGRALVQQQTHQPAANELRFDLLIERASVLDRQGRRLEKIEDINAVISIAAEINDDRRKAQAALLEAAMHADANRLDDARAAGERAIKFYMNATDSTGEINALYELAFLHWKNKDYGAALDYSRSILERHRRSGNVGKEAAALHNLGEIYRSLSSPKQALDFYKPALKLFWAVDNVIGQGMTLFGMSHAYWQMEKIDKATKIAHQALEFFSAEGDILMASRAHQKLAGLYWGAEDIQRAITHIEQALSISRQIGYGPGMAHGLVVAGYLYSLHGEFEKARIALDNAKIWFSLMDDLEALSEIDRLVWEIDSNAIEMKPPPNLDWVRGHVFLAGAKVFCEFETPYIRQNI